MRAVLVVFTFVFALGSAVALLGSGCGRQEEKDNEESAEDVDAPTLPPPSSLAIDLSVNGQAADSEANLLGFKHSVSMLIVAAVNLNIGAGLVIPRALIAKAAEVPPRLSAPGTYVWSFDLTAGGRTWTGNLTGVDSARGQSQTWSMRVSSNTIDQHGCCEDFIFFTGDTSGQSKGTWQIFDPKRPTEAAKLFAIRYDVSSTTEKTMRFDINSDRPDTSTFGNGSQVLYTSTSNNITMTISDSKDGGPTHEFEWSRETKAGKYTQPTGMQLCWGPEAEGFPDIDCP